MLNTTLRWAVIAGAVFVTWLGILPAFSPAQAAEEPNWKAEFLALCDAGVPILQKQSETAERTDRAYYWDSYLVRALCVAYDMTGREEYLRACQAWSDRMLECQAKMIPKGAYYMQYGRKPGEKTGNWYVADCASIAMGVLATSVRSKDPTQKRRYLDSVKEFAQLVAAHWVRPSGGVTDGYWPKLDKEWWCSTGIFGSLAFCLYHQTREPVWLKIGLGAIDWLNQQDLLAPVDFFPPKETTPTVLMYCLEAYSAGLPHLEPGTERHKRAIAQLAKARDWMTENLGGRAAHCLREPVGEQVGRTSLPSLRVCQAYAPERSRCAACR